MFNFTNIITIIVAGDSEIRECHRAFTWPSWFWQFKGTKFKIGIIRKSNKSTLGFHLKWERFRDLDSLIEYFKVLLSGNFIVLVQLFHLKVWYFIFHVSRNFQLQDYKRICNCTKIVKYGRWRKVPCESDIFKGFF